MNRFYKFALPLLFVTNLNCKRIRPSYKYPEIKKEITSDTLFDKAYIDEYRNIEFINNKEVLQWFADEKKLTDSILHTISGDEKLYHQIKSTIDDHASKISELSITDTDAYFYLKKSKTDPKATLYYRQGFTGKETFLYDPKDFSLSSGEGDFAINYIKPNWDGTLVAIGFSKNDSEFSELRIFDVARKTFLEDSINHINPGIVNGVQWLPDSSGFIYMHIPEIDPEKEGYLENSQCILYMLGSTRKNNKVLFSKTHNPELPIVEASFPKVYIKDQHTKYLIARIGSIGFNDHFYAPITALNTDKKIPWQPLFSKEDQVKSYRISDDVIYFRTAKGAKHYQLCKTSLKNPDFKNPTVLIPEDDKAVLSDFALTSKGLFYVKTTNGVEAKLYQFDETTGTSSELKMSKASGYLNVSSKGSNFQDLYISCKGWINDKEAYKYNFTTNSFEAHNLSTVKKHPSLENVVIEEIEIPSHDGVMLPLSLVYHQGLKKNKKNRVLFTAYGSYGYVDSPYLDKYLLHWLHEGGMYVTAHVRGGGEKGEAWHKAGYKTTKPNTWKDLIAATEYLIHEKFTTPDKIALWSGSSGGICIGRAVTERPDLFAAVFLRAGVLNVFRREFGANGKNNIREYGSVKDSIECKALYAMDAYQHIKKGVAYPAMYLTGGLNDARTPAWQPAKFAAKMQEYNSSDKPILLSIDPEGGHGFQASQEKKDQETVNVMKFLLWQTGHPDYQLKE